MRTLCTLFLLLFFVGCSKEKIEPGKEKLPSKTQKGKGIFACHIDNETYKFFNQGLMTYNKTTGYLFLNIRGNQDREFRLFVYNGIYDQGLYSFELTGEEYIISPKSLDYGIRENVINQLHIT